MSCNENVQLHSTARQIIALTSFQKYIRGYLSREPCSNLNEPYTIILLALYYVYNNSWEEATALFSLLKNLDLKGSDYFWQEQGKSNNVDGFIVLFFLLRQGVISKNDK